MIWTHVSELALDKLLAGEVAPVEAEAIRDHATGCAPCAARLAAAVATRDEVLPPLRLLRAVPASQPPVVVARAAATPRRWASSAAAVTTLAAAVVFVMAWPRGHKSTTAAHARAAEIAEPVEVAAPVDVAPPQLAGPIERAKGDAIAGLFVAHGGDIRRGGARELVAPGDRIELFTTSSRALWFAAVGDDGAGQHTVYVPPQRIAPGRERLLPLAIELDATPGDETLTAVFCAAPFEASAVAPNASLPPGCTVEHFTLVKAAR